MGYQLPSMVKATDLTDSEAAKWTASKLPSDGTLPRPGILFTLDRALKIARGPMDSTGQKQTAIQLFDVLERRSVVHVELDTFLKYPKNHLKLRLKKEEDWLDVLLELVTEWDRVNAVAQKAFAAVQRESAGDTVRTAKDWNSFKQSSHAPGRSHPSGRRRSRHVTSASPAASCESAQQVVKTLYDLFSSSAQSSAYGGSDTAWKWTQCSIAKDPRQTETCSSIIGERTRGTESQAS